MQSETQTPISSVGRKSIVVIADDALTARIVKAVIRSAQGAIDCLSSCEMGGVELAVAILAATDSPGQLVLINLSEGRRNLVIAQQLRLWGYSGPLIALTNDDDRREYVDAGFDDFLRKPIQPLSLIALAEKHL